MHSSRSKGRTPRAAGASNGNDECGPNIASYTLVETTHTLCYKTASGFPECYT